METFTVKNLTFTYPNKTAPALNNVNFSIGLGEFVVICGQSGSGKSTLLRSFKPVLAPHGVRSGEILFYGKDVAGLDRHTQAARIGYVLQDPDAQIVTDKVWHELAFGLESLGMDTKTIRLRVAEMASFFGIQSWFHKDVNHLSGGQKQLLNLASVMAMQPDVLILDEPTSQLDPIAATDFLETVKKINRELGTTVIITEHRLEEVIPMADQVIVLDAGRVIADDIPANTGAILAQSGHPMYKAMPTPLQAYAMLYQEGTGRQLECPVDVREGRNWLTKLLAGCDLVKTGFEAQEETEGAGETVLEMKDVWFRYERQGADVIKDLNLKVKAGEMFCIVGGNGTGKTTALSMACGAKKPYRGAVRIKGRGIEKYRNGELFRGVVGMLPQNPQNLFVEKTVRADLMEVLEQEPLAEEKVAEIAQLLEISHLLDMHPYDLSGGEQQRAALAKVLLLDPEILLLDEPTKGIDNEFKSRLAEILKKLQDRGVTIVMVSHDIEFCGRYGDKCAMFFDGKIITTNTPRKFFSGNSFYTTAANRMSRHIFDNAVNVDDIVQLVRENLGGRTGEPGSGNADGAEGGAESEADNGAGSGNDRSETGGVQECSCVPEKEVKPFRHEEAVTLKRKKTGRQLLLEAAMWILAAVTIYVGLFAMEEKAYMPVSLLLIVYTMAPFFAGFERGMPKSRELVILAVIIAVAVASRAAFFMIPSFKPMIAIVIISGAALGKESGFLIGALSVFVSNFMFGQGPWTPYQMMGMALAGYMAGLIFHRYGSAVKKLPLVIYGAVASFVMYGLIVDMWTIFTMTQAPTLETVIGVYASALYMNIIHTSATIIFILILAKPMIENMERIKIKYGIGG